jgi:hypothetical protein
MTALYVITNEYRAAAAQLSDLDLSPDVVADTLESLTGDIEVKAQNVAFVARNCEALAAQIKEAEKQMADRRKALEARAARLRDYMLACLMVAGIKKIEGPMLKISVRDNPEAVEIFDAAQLPESMMKQPEPPPPAPDKAAIKAAIKAGQDVPGARLTRGQRLDISG